MIWNKGNIKITNNILMVSLIVTTIWYFIHTKLSYLNNPDLYLGMSTLLNIFENLFNAVYTLTFILFLFLLFYKNNKKMFIPFTIISIIKLIYTILIIISALNYSQYFSDYSIYVISGLQLLLILPYFKLYANEASIINYQKENNTKPKDWIVLITVIIVIILATVPKNYVYDSIPKKHFEKLILSIQKDATNTSVVTDFSIKTIAQNKKTATFKVVKPLEDSMHGETEPVRYFADIWRKDLSGEIVAVIGRAEDLFLKTPDTDARDFETNTINGESYKFQYSNKTYYYLGSTEGDNSVMLTTKLKNGYWYFIIFQRKACAVITLEELKGLLDVQ